MATASNYSEALCASEIDYDIDLHSIDIVDLEFKDGTLYLIAEEKAKQEFSKLNEPRCTILRNKKNKVLILVKGEKKAAFEEMSKDEIQKNAPRTQFIIQCYKETIPTGLVVAISVKTEKKIYTMSCKDKKLHFKEGEPPQKIQDKEKDVLFYEEGVKGQDRRRFRSVLYPEFYLASKEEKKNFKLILKKGCQDKEGSADFIVQPCQKKE
ncbi:interleukin-18-like [Gracilinanus agilis]|uniref:interleukin-18-like n=1 Tax=Gracilinanus agilis TaxID=191870 RepID=UPI001CFC69D3|nr:interleukin-18-like [Gracilinanus agilis]